MLCGTVHCGLLDCPSEHEASFCTQLFNAIEYICSTLIFNALEVSKASGISTFGQLLSTSNHFYGRPCINYRSRLLRCEIIAKCSNDI